MSLRFQKRIKILPGPIPELASLYKAKGASCAAFITACNPFSRMLSNQDNAKRLVDLGAHVIFCWGERGNALVPFGGNWRNIGRDYVWLSEGLALRTAMAVDRTDQPAVQQVARGDL